MAEEIWKAIPGYEGYYEVSNLGQVRSLDREILHKKHGIQKRKGKIVSSHIGKRGYLSTYLSKEGKIKTLKVHQVVAMAFLNHTPCGLKVVVDHINNNSLDNRLENLQLISNRENLSKDKKPKSGYTGVYRNGKGFLAQIQINKKTINLGTFKTAEEASEAYQNKLKLTKYINE